MCVSDCEGHEENMRFLSGDIIETNEVDPFLTEPYTSGHVFAVSLLHTVMSTVSRSYTSCVVLSVIPLRCVYNVRGRRNRVCVGGVKQCALVCV